MGKVTIKMKDCYGIKSLNEILDFSKFNVNLIYASNGLMKTSFQKGFKQFSENKGVRDEVNGVPGKIEISNQDGTLYPAENILSFKSLDIGFISRSLESLLVDDSLKKQYIKLTKEIDDGIKRILEELRKKSGLTGNQVEQTLKTDLGVLNKTFIQILNDIYFDIERYSVFLDISYNDLFKDKDVFSLIQKPENIKLLKEYELKKQGILDKYNFYKKGGFEPSKAQKLVNALEDNKFLEVIDAEGERQNAIILAKEEFYDIESLKKAINDSVLDLSTSTELRDITNMLSKGVQAKDKFAELLSSKGQDFVDRLLDVEKLKKDIWFSYLFDLKDIIKQLIQLYNNNFEEIKDIIDSANIQKTPWYEVIDKHKKRFKLPFEVSIDKEQNVIIGIEQPTLLFSYDSGRIKLTHNSLIQKDILSGGELRALYILNILFDIKEAEKTGKEYLLIFDDIADSFDYQNKYAILYYLKEISKNKKFKIIILTHNFDFFRNAQKKILGNTNMKQCYISYGSNGNITLNSIEKLGIMDPFTKWKQEFDIKGNGAKLIGLIAFMREIAGYNGHAEYVKLTALLHIKLIPDTFSITLKQLQSIIQDFFKDDSVAGGKNLSNHIQSDSDTVFDFLDKRVIPQIHTKTESWLLEEKVAMSIYLRLKVENYIISYLVSLGTFIGNNGKSYNTCADYLSSITKVQTGVLIETYISLKPTCPNIDLFNDINLITSENIHLNSFMYEPILDTPEDELKRLYDETKMKL